MRSKIKDFKVKKLTVNECKNIKGGSSYTTPPIVKPTGRPRPWMELFNI